MKLRIPSNCPACGGEYEATKMSCKKCNSELTGHFCGCTFCSLSDDDMHFVLTFLKCRGSIKDVEKQLGISYPTVRSKLDTVLKNLGLSVSLSQDEIKQQRQELFEKLNNGEISADEAAAKLRNL